MAPSNPFARAAQGGVAYAVSVFACGFVLGTVRVLLVAPRSGTTAAVLVETPFILAASWFLSRYWMKRARVGAERPARLLAGALAFATLMFLEVALSVMVFQRSVAETLAGFQSAAGAIGLAGQIAFACFPVLDGIRRGRVGNAGSGKR